MRRRRKTSSILEIQWLADLIEFLNKSPPKGWVHLYRGHGNSSWERKPSLFREESYRENERVILGELMAIQPNEFREDATAFERLVRMQHYGAPTRLLDLSYNPLVGLYFASLPDPKKDKKAPEPDGELVRFTFEESKIKYFDSDTISCVANLSNLRAAERKKIRGFTSNKELKNSPEGKRLLYFIQAEKPFFQPRIRLRDLKSVFAVRPKLTNQRIIAQQGAFLIFGEAPPTLKFKVDVFRIRGQEKEQLQKGLDGISINLRTLYPEIEKASDYIKSKLGPTQVTQARSRNSKRLRGSTTQQTRRRRSSRRLPNRP